VRAKVIKRAGGICEGCLTCAATDVHHLTYRNLFAEFMFQLVALCRGCHDRVHAPPKKAAHPGKPRRGRRRTGFGS
jgi:5-methylcytosine-specific restriction endonuclease McrA